MAEINGRRKIIRIAIVGGPCGGKSSLKECVQKELTAIGYKAIFAPEIATMHWNAGIAVADAIRDDEAVYNFENSILRNQLFQEDSWARTASDLGYQIVFYDRGVSDVASYMSQSEYKRLLSENGGLAPHDVHARYDGVIYLVSAADGAEKFYTCENNPMRYEKTPELALETELKTRNAWLGHPRLHMIRNIYNGKCISFEEKMLRATETIKRIINDPPLELERKFVLPSNISPLNLFPSLGPTKTTTIFQVYSQTSDTGLIHRLRISKFDDDAKCHFIHTTKRRLSDGLAEINEKHFNKNESPPMLRMDHEPSFICKLRWSFFYNSQYFHFDQISHPTTLNILEIHPSKMTDEVDLPDNLKQAREVTGDPAYTNESIAANICPGY